MEVKARAPGKIILSGEHAVVHGSTAVAASIDLYTYVSLRISTPSDDRDSLKLQLKDTALEFSWPISRIREAFPESAALVPSAPTSCSVESAKSIAALVEEQNIQEAKFALASGVSAFLWLYSSIQGFKPATVVVTSDLPLGSGLGSSAAFCVALSAALLAFTDSASVDLNQQGWQSFEEKELDLVNKWAFEGEKIIHGKPSGIDNTVSAYGNIISFKSGNLTHMKPNVSLKMLITNTKVGRNTKALVAGVSERMLRHPDAMAFVFSAVDSISKELTAILQSPMPDDLSVTEKEEKIEELMGMNQGLLQSMGVSHATIETVLRTTLKYKLASKLTGAGGGGCVLTLLPTLLSGTVVDKVIVELESSGFQCFIAGIGGKVRAGELGCWIHGMFFPGLCLLLLRGEVLSSGSHFHEQGFSDELLKMWLGKVSVWNESKMYICRCVLIKDAEVMMNAASASVMDAARVTVMEAKVYTRCLRMILWMPRAEEWEKEL